MRVVSGSVAVSAGEPPPTKSSVLVCTEQPRLWQKHKVHGDGAPTDLDRPEVDGRWGQASDKSDRRTEWLRSFLSMCWGESVENTEPCMSVCLPACTAECLSIYVHLSVWLTSSVRLPVCLCLYLPSCLSFCLSLYLTIISRHEESSAAKSKGYSCCGRRPNPRPHYPNHQRR